MICTYPGCDDRAEFTITASGYPMPMGRVCAEHLAAKLLDDVSHGGSTMRWETVYIGGIEPTP